MPRAKSEFTFIEGAQNRVEFPQQSTANEAEWIVVTRVWDLRGERYILCDGAQVEIFLRTR